MTAFAIFDEILPPQGLLLAELKIGNSQFWNYWETVKAIMGLRHRDVYETWQHMAKTHNYLLYCTETKLSLNIPRAYVFSRLQYKSLDAKLPNPWGASDSHTILEQDPKANQIQNAVTYQKKYLLW